MAVIDKRKCYLFQTSDGGNDEISAAARVEFLQPLAVSSSARIANLLAIMSSIVSLHAECRYATLRQLYYANINIAKGQRVIESSVSALTRLLQVPREGLRITSTAKCIIRGPIVIREKHYTQDFSVPKAIPLSLPSADEAGAFHGVSLVDMPEIPESKRRLLSG
ncbi:meiotic recombination protein rec12 [Cyclospora cayetanensis]|uniref:Meiotic recombination protein rec12 n=1 Tax=Cyclospora cayetanensis TaxID=88456 RepID=A0A1D3CV08_9EIME|nr:meiotic recombination protein rec12 [Cyclospora cayetanensis]